MARHHVVLRKNPNETRLKALTLKQLIVSNHITVDLICKMIQSYGAEDGCNDEIRLTVCPPGTDTAKVVEPNLTVLQIKEKYFHAANMDYLRITYQTKKLADHIPCI